jgi:NodT family efflux transporter outer membrane factor (OMF) lipoprotein
MNIMFRKSIVTSVGIACISMLYMACSTPAFRQRSAHPPVPAGYNALKDTVNTAQTKWANFFTDPYLKALIDTALQNNQELNIMMQEISIAQNEVRARKGEYLPFVHLGAGAGAEKSGRYTRNGAVDANTNITPGQPIPDPLPDYLVAATVSWEVDIWKKLRNARKSAIYRYLSTVEGKNFMVTHLVSEVANSYYELIALDNQLEILKRNIEIQQNALEIVRLEKQAAKVTELAVRKFEAEVLKNQSRQYYIMQQITETENRINFLVGRFPQPILRNAQTFTGLVPDTIRAGIPSQLLANRPDIRQTEQQLAAAQLDVKVARANFYPSFTIMAGLGYQAFNPQYLVSTPESMLYSLTGELVAPLINRNAIKATYYSATSKQVQAAFQYERTVLQAYMEVVNQLSNINNLAKSYDLKTKQVEALTRSIDISTVLFKAARADYMEVLMTQRDALESKFELIETKKQQMNAMVTIYQALGGGWK